MPTPAKTSDEAILLAARDVLERNGSTRFSLNDVAAAVGVKTPSLYKRITDRDTVLATLEQRGFDELRDHMRLASTEPEPLRAMAVAYRQFAMRSPQLYARMLAPDATRSDESLRWRHESVAPVISALTTLVGATHARVAARTVTAFLHGFVMMEQASAFRLGGNIDADFHDALDAVLRGISMMW